MSARHTPDSFRARYLENEATGCWEWTGCTNKNGYGILTYSNKGWLAHRLSYTLWVGEIPAGLGVLHKCDNKICGNPAHFFVGTNADNSQDMVKKGRQAKGSQFGATISAAVARSKTHPSKTGKHGLYARGGDLHPSTRISVAQREEIKTLYATGKYFQRDLGVLYGVCENTIFRILKGRVSETYERKL